MGGPEDASLRRRGQIFIALAALAWSTAGVLQRGLSIDTTTQLAGRALFAFLALIGFVAVVNRGRTPAGSGDPRLTGQSSLEHGTPGN